MTYENKVLYHLFELIQQLMTQLTSGSQIALILANQTYIGVNSIARTMCGSLIFRGVSNYPQLIHLAITKYRGKVRSKMRYRVEQNVKLQRFIPDSAAFIVKCTNMETQRGETVQFYNEDAIIVYLQKIVEAALLHKTSTANIVLLVHGELNRLESLGVELDKDLVNELILSHCHGKVYFQIRHDDFVMYSDNAETKSINLSKY